MFDSANQYCFEAFFREAYDEQAHVVVREGFSKERKLRTYLSAEQEAQVNAEVGKTTVPIGIGDLEAMRPWAAAATLGALAVQHAGLTAPGADMILQQRALATKRAIFVLEQPTQFAHRRADLPDKISADRLRTFLAHANEAESFAKTGVSLWAAGDLDGMARHIAQYQDVTAAKTLAAQNAAWTSYWTPRQGLGPTVFIDVGIEHLVGPNNMRDLLAKAGFTLERLQ